MPQRDFYIDRLRTVLTALVVVFHTAITYGATGGWYYHEIESSYGLSSLLLTLFVVTNQAYFMGFFFLLAGYFTPASLERKGYALFIADRFLRLGLPLAAYILILGPLTLALAEFTRGDGFWSTLAWLWQHKEVNNGPLWFVQALLIFSLAYCAWRAVLGSAVAQSERTPKPVPGYGWWLTSATGVAATALAVRQFVPAGENVFGLQLGYFASYIFLFGVGVAAWRYDWLRQLTWKNARPWIVPLLIAWPLMPLGIEMAHAIYGKAKSNFSGGLSWPAILYACWEPFVAWGLIAACLLLFRERMNQPSKLWTWLNRRAYAAYIIHPPVLVGVSLLLHAWVAPALVKFGVVGLLAVIATWLAADPLVRMPGLRRVV
jgi:peptidoglycan/LPS O-acetylase OafA/YrhL